MIRSFEIRSTIGQYEKYNTAVNTFKLKYNGLPGDILSTNALAFGLYCLGGTPTTCTGGAGKGDGNSRIRGIGGLSASSQGGETILFWRHLSDTNLIAGSYGQGSTITQATGFGIVSSASTYLPSATMGKGLYWLAGAEPYDNHFLLTTGIYGASAGLATTPSGGMTPIEAFAIDVKLDDGLPNTGKIQARGTATSEAFLFQDLSAAGFAHYSVNHFQGSEAAGDCTVTPTSVGSADPNSVFDTYSIGSVAGDVKACALRLKFQ